MGRTGVPNAYWRTMEAYCRPIGKAKCLFGPYDHVFFGGEVVGPIIVHKMLSLDTDFVFKFYALKR